MSMIEEQINELEALRKAMVAESFAFEAISGQPLSKTLDNRIRIIDNAIDTIKTLSEKLHAESMERSSQYYNGGWIPCSERLPPRDFPDATGVVVEMAWRPLPEPYKE